MNFEKNDVLANLFANAIRSPQPSTSSAAASPAARPSVSHSKSLGAQQWTPRRPQAADKRVPRRSTTSFAHGATPFPSHHHTMARKTTGVVSHPPNSSIVFAGAKFTDSPSARAIPLPPTDWFDDDRESPSVCSDTESLCSFTTASSSSSASLPLLGLESSALSPSDDLAFPRPQGMRFTPFQLITAVGRSAFEL